MLPTPHYIIEAKPASDVVRFPWDEWNCSQYYESVDDAMLERLEHLTSKASAGLCVAIGEWICERFSTLDPDPSPKEYLEAAWAGVVHRAYCAYTETTDDEWRGPVRAPMALTITLVNEALSDLADGSHVACWACALYNLARHVLPDPQAFDTWFEACVLRMEQYHSQATESRGDEDEEDVFANHPSQGLPVPREAFDPAFAYSPMAAPALLDAFLRSLRPELNPYLLSPEELADNQEITKPYRYGP